MIDNRHGPGGHVPAGGFTTMTRPGRWHGPAAGTCNRLGHARVGDCPLSVRVRPSSLKRDCDRRTTSTGSNVWVNAHEVTLEPGASTATPVRSQRARHEPALTGREPSPAQRSRSWRAAATGASAPGSHGARASHVLHAAVASGQSWSLPNPLSATKAGRPVAISPGGISWNPWRCGRAAAA
jgi:hypothetical protein